MAAKHKHYVSIDSVKGAPMHIVAETPAYEAGINYHIRTFVYSDSYNAVAVDFKFYVSDVRLFLPGKNISASRVGCTVFICTFDGVEFNDIAEKKIEVTAPYADFGFHVKTFISLPAGALKSGNRYFVRVVCGEKCAIGHFYIVDKGYDDYACFRTLRAGMMRRESPGTLLRSFRASTVEESAATSECAYYDFDDGYDFDDDEACEEQSDACPYRPRYAVFDVDFDWVYDDFLPECTMLFAYADGRSEEVVAFSKDITPPDADSVRIRFMAADPRPDAPCGPVYVSLNWLLTTALAGFVTEKLPSDAREESGDFGPAELKPVNAYKTAKGLAILERAHSRRADAASPSAEGSDSMAELAKMVGLGNVKAKVRRYMSLMAFQRKRADKGISSKMPPLHALFLGAPGTGKTSIAELMGRLMKEAGVLSKGHVVVRERSQIVGRHYGDESAAMLKALEEAEGGVLFIDEAYNLYRENDPKDPGRDAVDALLTALADPRRRNWMLILGGYEDRILKMFEMNPGLASRFPESNRYRFEDYTADELLQIAENYCADNAYTFTPEAREKLYGRLRADVEAKDETFGNARHVLNLVETEILPAMAERVAAMAAPDAQALTMILPADIPARTACPNGPRRPGVGFRA